MSGRRSSSVDGKPTDTTGGGCDWVGAAGIDNVGRRPARQHGDRVLELRARNAQVGQLRTGGFQLRLSQGDVGHRDDAAFESVLGQLRVLFVRLHRGVEQLPLRVESLKLEVVGGELRLVQQPGVLEVCGRRLRDRGVGGHAAPDASPDVGLIGHVNRDRVQALRARRRARSGTRGGRRGGHGRETDPPG